MNIRTNKAGSVNGKHIISRGFRVFDKIEGYEFQIPQYTNDIVKITGGYWTWYVSDMNGNKLWEGWWNTNNEFDETMDELEAVAQ